jgi:hypothetical protein
MPRVGSGLKRPFARNGREFSRPPFKCLDHGVIRNRKGCYAIFCMSARLANMAGAFAESWRKHSLDVLALRTRNG